MRAELLKHGRPLGGTPGVEQLVNAWVRHQMPPPPPPAASACYQHGGGGGGGGYGVGGHLVAAASDHEVLSAAVLWRRVFFCLRCGGVAEAGAMLAGAHADPSVYGVAREDVPLELVDAVQQLARQRAEGDNLNLAAHAGQATSYEELQERLKARRQERGVHFAGAASGGATADPFELAVRTTDLTSDDFLFLSSSTDSRLTPLLVSAPPSHL